MRRSDYQSSNLVGAGAAGVIALMGATLSAYILTGIPQAVVLAVCFAVMAASIVVSLAEQHKLEKATTPQLAEAPSPQADRHASGNRTMAPFSGLEVRA